jgi:gluconolactonase
MLTRRTLLTSALGAAALRAQSKRDWPGANPISYPDPDIIALDPKRFRYKLINAGIERVYTGCRWSEGPAWNGNAQCLVWSDIPNDRQLRFTPEDGGHVSVIRPHSNYSNGNTFDYQGRQLSCEHDARRVVRYEPDGSVTVLADKFEGKPLNAPNDIVVHPDGAIWFTDPGYGIMGQYEGHLDKLEIKEAIYRIDSKTGQMEKVADDLIKPNGLCFSPDYKKLYVCDTGGPTDGSVPNVIQVYDVDGVKLRNSRVFANMRNRDARLPQVTGNADGIRSDIDGNIWAGVGWGAPGFDGVHCFAPNGDRIGVILLPEVCANVCFGGRYRNRLFMAASQSLYSVYLDTRGAHIC